MMDSADKSLIEELWHELDGQVSREQIGRTVTEVVSRFQEAKVTTFVPIFVHRRALEQLKGSLVEGSLLAHGGAPADEE